MISDIFEEFYSMNMFDTGISHTVSAASSVPEFGGVST
jgi:hypothetical protein